MILGEIIARSNDANNDSLKLVLVVSELLISKNGWNSRDCFVKVFALDLDFGLLACWIFHCADNFFALVFKMEVSEKFATIIKRVFAGCAARVGDKD